MPAFIAPDVKVALVALLNDRPGLADIQVTNGYPGDDAAEPERIFTGNCRSQEVEIAGMKAGRTHYQERGELDVIIDAIMPDGTAEDSEARCQEFLREVAECVADNRTLGNVPGLNFVACARWDLQTRYGATGSWSQATYTIRYEARLT